jgi:hypothetical protein
MAKKTNYPPKKTVCCTFCGGPIEVSLKAMSIFCPHCHKRVVCEDYTIKSYHAVRSVATCGDVIVERKGHVVAPVRATSLIVRGLVRGDVLVHKLVEIESSGTIQGNIQAPRLVMHDGGKLIGKCTITRNGSTSHPKPPAKPPQAPTARGPASAARNAPAPKPSDQVPA